MFTGIVEGVGLVKKIENYRTHTRIRIGAPFSLLGTRLGDSIAVDGCCLTVTSRKGREFTADLSPETLAVTGLGELKKGARVNIERPLRMGDRLGGHLVQGHVDGTGKIASSELVEAKPSSYYLMKVKVPKKLMTYMVPKGSVTVDGISLTINEVKGSKISLCIIPHTQEKTTLTEKIPGDTLNLEADILLKFVDQMIQPTLKQWTKKLKPKSKRK